MPPKKGERSDREEKKLLYCTLPQCCAPEVKSLKKRSWASQASSFLFFLLSLSLCYRCLQIICAPSLSLSLSLLLHCCTSTEELGYSGLGQYRDSGLIGNYSGQHKSHQMMIHTSKRENLSRLSEFHCTSSRGGGGREMAISFLFLSLFFATPSFPFAAYTQNDMSV